MTNGEKMIWAAVFSDTLRHNGFNARDAIINAATTIRDLNQLDFTMFEFNCDWYNKLQEMIDE